jgi:hypothetical protein
VHGAHELRADGPRGGRWQPGGGGAPRGGDRPRHRGAAPPDLRTQTQPAFPGLDGGAGTAEPGFQADSQELRPRLWAPKSGQAGLGQVRTAVRPKLSASARIRAYWGTLTSGSPDSHAGCPADAKPFSVVCNYSDESIKHPK